MKWIEEEFEYPWRNSFPQTLNELNRKLNNSRSSPLEEIKYIE